MRLLTIGAMQQQRNITGIKPTYIYGLLYNWYVAENAMIGNSGFTVPILAEWNAMRTYIIDTYNVAPNDFGDGNHLKSCRQINSPLGGECDTSEHPRWDSHSTQYGRNTVNFAGLPGGFRNDSGGFANIGTFGFFWVSELTRYRFLRNSSSVLNEFEPSVKNGASIRLSRPATASELLITEGEIIPYYYRGNNDFLYDCVRIDDRIWTAQNLAETHWNNGDAIPNVTNAADWSNLVTAGMCAYNNDVNTWGYTL